ncbi:hypothetical protein EMIT019CA3_10174 [Bacillus pseudomycoides]
MFSLFVLTLHGAGRGSDRFYEWPVILSHLKIGFYVGFSNCIHIVSF